MSEVAAGGVQVSESLGEAARARPDGLPLAVVTAEALHGLCGDEASAIPADLPAFATDGEQAAAVDAAVRSLVAAAQVGQGDDGTYVARGPLAVALQARLWSPTVTLVHRATPAGAVEVAAYHLASGDLVVTEEVIAPGLHGFRLWQRVHAEDALAAQFGFDLQPEVAEAKPPVRGSFDGDVFRPHPGEDAASLQADLDAAMHITSVITRAGAGEEAITHELTVVDGCSGTTWVLTGPDATGEVVAEDATTVALRSAFHSLWEPRPAA